VLFPLGKTFQYQENLPLVLKKRLVLGIFLDYLCLCQLRFLSFPKPELFLPHRSSKIVLSDALMSVGCLPDHSFVSFVLLAQFLEHSPMETVLYNSEVLRTILLYPELVRVETKLIFSSLNPNSIIL
jgi:hypothetical protein